VLLVRKIDADDWTLPGGIIDLGESPIQTVVREVKEEANVKVRALGVVGVFGPADGFKWTYSNGDMVEYVDILFECEAIRGTPCDDDDEIAEARYFTAAEVAGITSAYPIPLVELLKAKAPIFDRSIQYPTDQFVDRRLAQDNIKDAVLEAAGVAVRGIVWRQHDDYLRGRGKIDRINGAPVTPADRIAQADYVRYFNKAFGAQSIFYANEETVRDAQDRANAAHAKSASYRIAIDPIDGTANYAGDPKIARKAVNRSIQELHEAELRGAAVRPGWGSMIAIQQRAPVHQWRTIASAIYESRSTDTPKNLKGNLYFAQTGVPHLKAINLQTGRERTILPPPVVSHSKLVVQGGFPHTAWGVTTQKAIQRHVASSGYSLIDFSCVAQSAIAVVTRMAAGYFQGHPHLHDVLAIAHLAVKSGVFVVVVDSHNGKPFTGDRGNKKAYYPVFMSVRAELAWSMMQQFIHATGLSSNRFVFRNGFWECKSYGQIKEQVAAHGEG
jgi:8-oxo-dGTP pyrophosphatase MutT (NUDIX family)